MYTSCYRILCNTNIKWECHVEQMTYSKNKPNLDKHNVLNRFPWLQIILHATKIKEWHRNYYIQKKHIPEVNACVFYSSNNLDVFNYS